ncbi:NEDD8-conjugating enzyme Ubc12 [Coccomyxa sp. Obi]|nr:NEDD8-conjugating enzyme Ubc12 [Coccomyxa sp. Obi]
MPHQARPENQRMEAAAANGEGVRISAGELRLEKDLLELDLQKGMSIRFPEGEHKLLHFEITMKPDKGIYEGGTFTFDFAIATSYPHHAPDVRCKTKVFHPNIDLEGNVGLKILREDWKPILSIKVVIEALQFLFWHPNPEEPLNKEAAEMQKNNPRQFESNVQASIMRGHHINGHYFPPCME